MVEIDNRAILVILFTLVIGMMAIYTLGDNPESLETDSQPDINETESSEDGSVQENNLTGETREIYGSGEEREQEPEELEEKEGIMLDTQPVAGESNRMILYENGERVSQETIYINDEDIGQTNNAGALRFEVPNTNEMEIRALGETYVENVENYSEEISIELAENPTAGEINTIRITEPENIDEPIQIYVNEQTVGETTEELDILVPLEDELKVSTVSDAHQDAEETYDVERKDVEFYISNPQMNQELEHNEMRTEFEINNRNAQDLTYYLDINQRTVRQGPASQGLNNYMFEEAVRDEGEHEILITAEETETGETFTSDKIPFTTTSELEPIQINNMNPGDGETINDYSTDLEFSISSPLEYNYSVIFEDEVIQSPPAPKEPGEENFGPVTQVPLSPGEHEWTVKVEDSAGEQFERTSTFETTEEPPLGDIELISPEDGSEVITAEGEIYLQFRADIYEESANYRLIANDQERLSGSLEEGTNYENVQFDDDGSEDYEWYVEIDSEKTSLEQVTSETWSFEVVGDEEAGGPEDE